MTKKKSDRLKADAKKVEVALRAEGRHREADAVAKLRKSAASAVATLRILHRDNMELRRRLGMPSFLDESTTPPENT